MRPPTALFIFAVLRISFAMPFFGGTQQATAQQKANQANAQAKAQQQATACETVQSPPDPSCWPALGVDNWIKAWNSTTTRCSPTQALGQDSCQCSAVESWADCFMRLASPLNNANQSICDDLSPDNQCSAPIAAQIAPGVPVQAYYGAYSIWSLNRYMTTWNTAINSNASLQAIANLANANIAANPTVPNTDANLLVQLMNAYSANHNIATSFIENVVPKAAPATITLTVTSLQDAQKQMSTTMQAIMHEIMDDLSNGYFLSLGAGGKLLQGDINTVGTLEAELVAATGP